MKTDCPREAEISTVDVFCDHLGCNKRLDRQSIVWVWNEHMCCSRDHAQRAQGRTNMFAEQDAETEERDIDLL